MSEPRRNADLPIIIALVTYRIDAHCTLCRHPHIIQVQNSRSIRNENGAIEPFAKLSKVDDFIPQKG